MTLCVAPSAAGWMVLEDDRVLVEVAGKGAAVEHALREQQRRPQTVIIRRRADHAVQKRLPARDREAAPAAPAAS